MINQRYHFNAATAAEAAGLQQKFWDAHDIIFENQSKWISKAYFFMLKQLAWI